MKQHSIVPRVMFLLMTVRLQWCDSLSLCDTSRRMILEHTIMGYFATFLPNGAWAYSSPSTLENFRYNEAWTGTDLQLLDIEEASQRLIWGMGRWPDPILRRSAAGVDEKWFGTQTLRRVTELLEKTATRNKAVGLAAQQCGVNARIVYIKLRRPVVMVNPQIVGRSDEQNMKVWQEYCLVLPPNFKATVLRDSWVDLEFRNWQGESHLVRLKGEAARAAQHELDHDRGILTLDHIALDEMETDLMRSIEREGHDQRMRLAYSRFIIEPKSKAVTRNTGSGN